MPYRYENRREGGQYFLVWNTGFGEKTLFRATPDYRHFITRLRAGATIDDGCRVIAFCLLRNQYYLILEETTPGATSKFMHRLSVAYAMYFNNRYDQSGKLFAGPYKDQQLVTDEALMLGIARIARLPEQYRQSIDTYRWSSLRSYTNGIHDWLYGESIRNYLRSEDAEALLQFVMSVAPGDVSSKAKTKA